MDLHVTLEPGRDRTAQLVHQIRAAIQSGRLTCGQRLPPTRLLAAQLGVARKTITTVYERLVAEGWLTARIGDGTYVSASAAAPTATAFPAPELPPPARRWLELPAPFLPDGGGTRRHAFPPGQADTSRFPHAVWSRCVRRALQQEREFAGGQADPRGEPALRQAIAGHLAFMRGIVTTADSVMVTAGAQQGLDLAIRLLLAPGMVAAMEDPGYPMARALLQASGATVVPVPVDEEGLVVEALPEDASVVYVTPSHQAPLGMTMTLQRRQALLAWAARRRAVVLEDDYDSEFRYAGHPVDALKTLDRDGRVIYLGTFSKTMMASLRCGYLVLPPWLAPAAMRLKHLVDWHAPTLLQRALALFVREGHLLRHIRRSGQRHAQRRERLLARLHGDLRPWLEALPAHVGFHLAARFRMPVHTDTLLALANRADLTLTPLDPFHASPPPACPGLLFGFGGIGVLDIDPALDRLAAVLQTLAPPDLANPATHGSASAGKKRKTLEQSANAPVIASS